MELYLTGLVLLFLATFPVYLIGRYVYKKDKNKEPKGLLIELFIFGIISTILTVFITNSLSVIFPEYYNDEANLDSVQTFFYVFFGIALIEEFSKWIVTYLVVYKNKEFDEFYDSIVYSCFVALGFACLENIFYVLPKGISTGVARTITAVPGHACYGVIMGYYIGLAKLDDINNRSSIKNKFFSIVVPTLLHGVYDYCIFIGNNMFLLIWVIFLLVLFITSIKTINKISKENKKIYFKNNYCSKCGTKIEGNYCYNCGNKNE